MNLTGESYNDVNLGFQLPGRYNKTRLFLCTERV
jgi:hypothetical protein